METNNKTQITVAATVNAPIAKVWQYFNEPEHIKQWAFASDDWHAPYSENDLRPGGIIKTTMAAKDGSFSFDFQGTYTEVEAHKLIAYTLGDGRQVTVTFREAGNGVEVTEVFDAESTHSIEMQQGGWQAILDNFRKHAENN